MGQPTGNDRVILEELMQEVCAGRIRLYRNLVHQPYVYCDLGERSDASLPAVHLNLFDRDFRHWLTLFGWERGGVLLGERQIDRILNALAGMALRDKTVCITDPATLALIESDPTLCVVLEFMHLPQNQGIRLEREMGVLWKELIKFAQGRGMLIRGHHRFPGGANVLSRKLRQLIPVLRHFGIIVDITRSNGARIVLRCSDDPADESSEQSSSNKSPSSENVRHKDGNETILAALEAKRRM